MTESYSPNLFLFQSYVGEVLKEGKKIIKTAPFEGIDPETLINNHKNQYIDAFHQYFLAAMGHLKTREIACSNYEKLIRQGLVDKQHLPPSLISSVLAACAGAGAPGGGSTSGSSSLGSASLSSAPQGHSLYIGNMIKTMLLGTCQPCGQLIQGLNYLLQGTHKKNAILYNAMLQQIYNSLLVKYRQSPLKRFVSSYLEMCLDEVQTHIDEQGYVFATRKFDTESGKFDIAIYKEGNGYGKFGKCFSCRKEASHYVKEQWLPICGLACRSNVKSLLFQCQGSQSFNLMNWLLDCLPSGEEAILTFLFRQLQNDASRSKISFAQMQTILKTLIHLLAPNHIISRPLLGILSLIMTKWSTMLHAEEITPARQQTLQNYFKVYLLQIVALIQEVPISKQHLDSINFLAEVARDSDFLINLFVRYDSKFFEPSILARMFNLISQYAKKFQHTLEGLYGIVQALTSRFIEKNMREDDWQGYGQFLKKREIREIIVAFNKKPMNGFKMLKKILGEAAERRVEVDEPEKEREPMAMVEMSRQSIDMAVQQQIRSAQQSIQQGEQSIREQQVDQQQQQKQQQQQNLELEQLQKQQQPLDSDLIINKRIDQMVEEQEQKSERTMQLTSQQESTQNRNSQSLSEKQQQSSVMQNVGTPKKQDKQRVQEDRFSQKKQQPIPSISDISPSKQNYGLGPRQIAIFIRQNLQLNAWTQAESKLPIPIPSLNKAKVGQFFGTDNAEIRKISLQFLNSFDFETTEIDDVMRVVMNSFSLPKQTQQIERIIGDLAVRLLGKYDFQDETGIYQYIYLLLMVQTTNHNPQVRQNQKLNLQQYLSMSKHLSGGGVPRERAEADFKRIISNSINVKKKYPKQTIFYQKYLASNLVESDFVEPNRGSLSRSLLLYLWEYLVIGLVWPGNELGLFEASLLMGREGLEQEQKGFFQALKKCLSDESQKQILRLAIQFGNDLIGKPWDTVVKLLYSMQQTHDCSTILDKLFTNSSKTSPARLKDFLHALLQFSSSQFQKDTTYTRQLFVLRHINSLIEYNIERFDQLAHLCWPLLKNYFKDICLHPRKEISMPAIDSFKQLSLKLFKLRIQALPHQTLFQTFLYVFERSGLEMKDLIANVMLNLITSDIRGGWDQIYSILDVLDTKDKQLVVKLIGRLIKEVGLQRLGNLQRLHSICIKELRVCGDQNATDQLLSQLWDLSSFIDEPTTWLETVRSIKDIFKISLNPQIINVLVRLCNKCVTEVDARKSLDKQILAEVIDLLMFLLQIRGGANKLAALITSLDHISKLSPEFQLKHLIGNCGLLQIFRMFLGSEQKIPFSLFLKKIIDEIYLPHLKQGEGDLQFQYLSYWCVHEFMNHLPLELLNLKENDKDFEQTLTGLIASPQAVDKEKQHVLIQFPQSYKEYYEKSLLQLIFLDIVESIYASLEERPKQKMQPLRQKIQVAVTQSFDCAFRVNRLILLRNFLWNNGFLIGRQLPGLLKQQHRSLLLAVKLFPFKKSYKMLKIYMKNYLETLQNIKKLKEINTAEAVHPKDNKKQSKNNEPKRQQSKGLIVYAHDASLWIRESETGMNQSLRAIREQVQSQSSQTLKAVQTEQLIDFLTTLLLQKNLPQKVCRSSAETLRVLYSLKL